MVEQKLHLMTKTKSCCFKIKFDQNTLFIFPIDSLLLKSLFAPEAFHKEINSVKL